MTRVGVAGPAVSEGPRCAANGSVRESAHEATERPEEWRHSPGLQVSHRHRRVAEADIGWSVPLTGTPRVLLAATQLDRAGRPLIVAMTYHNLLDKVD